MQTILTVQTIDAPLESLDAIGQYASNRESHLMVIVLGIAASLPAMAYSEAPAYDWGKDFNDKYNAALSRADELRERLTYKGVSVTTIAACQEISGIKDLICKNSFYSDYLLLPSTSTLPSNIHARCLDGALFDAGIPVLSMPDTIVDQHQIKNVLAAWHPSPHTARAFRSVMSLLDKNTRYHIVVVDPKEHVYGANPGDDIATYVARKHLNVAVERVAGNDQPTSDVIRQKSIDIDADLIVMGAYGHSKMREWFHGSTTTEMLTNLSKPLFLCH